MAMAKLFLSIFKIFQVSVRNSRMPCSMYVCVCVRVSVRYVHLWCVRVSLLDCLIICWCALSTKRRLGSSRATVRYFVFYFYMGIIYIHTYISPSLCLNRSRPSGWLHIHATTRKCKSQRLDLSALPPSCMQHPKTFATIYQKASSQFRLWEIILIS